MPEGYTGLKPKGTIVAFKRTLRHEFITFVHLTKPKALNIEFFIAKRLNSRKETQKRFPGTIMGIAVFGIALGLAVMLVAISIVTGFKEEISNKVIGFGSHIQILNYDSNFSFETSPIDASPDFLPLIKEIKGVKHIQEFALKAGIVKTQNDIQGLVLKGVGPDYDWGFFDKSMLEGSTFRMKTDTVSNSIVISSFLAKKLKLKTGDSFQMWFIQDTPRFRKFMVSGIYETSLQEFDKTFAITDIRHIQRLSGWEANQVSGLEMMVSDFKDIDRITAETDDIVSTSFFEDGSRLKVVNIIEKYPQIFDWLNLQDINVMVIIILMLIVAGINMISGLLIIILDRTNMIGILKALGTSNRSIRRIFLYQSSYLILKGLLWGNVLGIGLCLVQKYFGIIHLDPASYYLTTVPVNINLFNIFLLNAGTVLAILAFLILPSMLISRISPAESIRFK
jgi:lipoprotein-releasing system permease protein